MGFHPTNMTPENWKLLEEQGLIFDEDAHKPFSMDNCLSMDIETCSLKDTGGRFMVHNIGWGHAISGVDPIMDREHVKELVAQSEGDLVKSTVMWQALQEWQKLAVRVQEWGRGENLYVYAHNNAKFDGVAVMHAILSETKTPVEDMLVSNGKFISFRWKNLIFRDSMLIATSSLAAAAVAYGIKTRKSYLPHTYLQNCDSLSQLLYRIHSDVPWEELEPHMDWFHDTKMKDLQYRVKDRSFEQWRSEQETWKNFEPKSMCHFRHLSKEYLRNDVMCLYEIVAKMGKHMSDEYTADIRTKCTVGSIADHIWQHTC